MIPKEYVPGTYVQSTDYVCMYCMCVFDLNYSCVYRYDIVEQYLFLFYFLYYRSTQFCVCASVVH